MVIGKVLYIDDRLIDGSHKLGQGREAEFWLGVAHNFGIRHDDITYIELSYKDNMELGENGYLPNRFSELKDDYSR